MMKKIILFIFVFCSFITRGEPERFQVCSITLNSTDEINVFRKNLQPRRFTFVELVPIKHYGGEHRWLSQTCSSPQLRCDVLIVSGHFAGMFFGSDNDYILSMSELEEMACQNTCPHIFKNLKEVYLFGCNTMASKEQSLRTPEEYLRVLVEEHEMARDLAEHVVAGRYSVFGPTFKDKMEHIFSKKTRIYGFTDLSPLGKQARPLIQNYLSSIKKEYGGYYQYLIHDFYKQNRIKKKNHHFKEALSVVSSVAQSTGMSSSHFRKKTYDKTCALHSNERSNLSRMKMVKDILSNNNGLFSFSSIKQFLINEKENFSPEAVELFYEIQSMDSVRKQFLQAYSQLNPRLVYIKSQVLHFLHILGWVDENFYQNHLRQILLPFIQNPTRQSFDILNALRVQDKLDFVDIAIDYDDFPENYLKNIWSVLTVDVLRFDYLQMQKNLMDYCLREKNKDVVICYQVLKTLGHLKVTDKQILSIMKEFLKNADPGLVYYATYGLAYSGIRDPHIQLEIFKNLDHPEAWIRLQSLKTLEYLDLVRKGSNVENKIRDRLYVETDLKVRKAILNILNKNHQER